MMSDFRQRLQAGQPQVGMCAMYPAPGMIERLGGEWDFIWIDGQHGELDYNDMLAMVRACDHAGTASLVRVPWLEAGIIGKVLDTAASGVIVPCVDSVAEAKLAVAAAKFPPLGRRSYGGRRIIDLQGRTYSDTANQDQLLIVQIESPAAIEAAQEIAALDGVDALMIGPDDLMLRRGNAMTVPRSRETLGRDVKAIGDAAAAHGKIAMGVAMDEDLIQLHLQHGYRLIVSGGDVGFLANGSKTASALARGVLEKAGATRQAGASAESTRAGKSLY
jgi:4-hydroxy-2-oxoheptanedioate aldolase